MPPIPPPLVPPPPPFWGGGEKKGEGKGARGKGGTRWVGLSSKRSLKTRYLRTPAGLEKRNARFKEKGKVPVPLYPQVLGGPTPLPSRFPLVLPFYQKKQQRAAPAEPGGERGGGGVGVGGRGHRADQGGEGEKK